MSLNESIIEAQPQLTVWLLLVLAPLAIVACTAFTKVSIVFSALRIGLGAELLLPYIAVFTLALLVTGIVMAPTVEYCWDLAQRGGPWPDSPPQIVDRVISLSGPWLEFLRNHSSPKEIDFFSQLTGRTPNHPSVVVGSFLVTELGEALRISLIVLAPFVAIDLIATHIFAMLGLQVSAMVVTLPLKILLFLAVDGWDLLIAGLATGYQ